jgi:hypothetical protein
VFFFGGIKTMKMMTKIPLAVVTGILFASGAYASEPITLTEAQLDSITAGQFVCPVIKTAAVLNSPNAMMIGGGDYSIIGPTVTVPTHATNDNGAGLAGAAHASPGDANYTAIWDF